MAPLIFVGLLVLVSGALKSRERIRTQLGGTGLAPLEMLAGAVLLISVVPGLASEAAQSKLWWAAVVVGLISNLGAYAKIRAVMQRSEESEGSRLYQRIKYQEMVDPDSKG